MEIRRPALYRLSVLPVAFIGIGAWCIASSMFPNRTKAPDQSFKVRHFRDLAPGSEAFGTFLFVNGGDVYVCGCEEARAFLPLDGKDNQEFFSVERTDDGFRIIGPAEHPNVIRFDSYEMVALEKRLNHSFTLDEMMPVASR